MIGENEMSLVQVVILEEYIVVFSDTRGTHSDGRIVKDFKKVIRLNDKMAYGMTGGSLDCYKLIDGLCSFHQTQGVSSSKLTDNVNYENLLKFMTAQYCKLKQNSLLTNHNYDICSVLCGQNQDKLQITLFALGNEYIPDGIYNFFKGEKPYYLISLGMREHGEMFDKLAGEILLDKIFLGVGDCHLIAKQVFNAGVLIDNSIDNNLQTEILKIRR